MTGGPHNSLPPMPTVHHTAPVEVMQHVVQEPENWELVTPIGGANSINSSANLAQVSKVDGVDLMTRVVIPSVLALMSTILSYKATNMYFAKAAAGGRPVNQALAQTDSVMYEMYDIDY